MWRALCLTQNNSHELDATWHNLSGRPIIGLLWVVFSKTYSPSHYWETDKIEISDKIEILFRSYLMSVPKAAVKSYLNSIWNLYSATAIMFKEHVTQRRRPGADFGGDGIFFRGPRFLKYVFFRKNFHFHAQNFLWPFLVIDLVFQIFLCLL